MDETAAVVLEDVAEGQVDNDVQHESKGERQDDECALVVVALDGGVEAEYHAVNHSEWNVELADPYILELILEFPIIVFPCDLHSDYCSYHCDQSAIQDDATEDIVFISG